MKSGICACGCGKKTKRFLNGDFAKYIKGHRNEPKMSQCKCGKQKSFFADNCRECSCKLTRKYTDDDFQKMLSMKKEGSPLREIARKFGLSAWGVCLIFKSHNIEQFWCKQCQAPLGRNRKRLCEKCIVKNRKDSLKKARIKSMKKCECGAIMSATAKTCVKCRRKIDDKLLKVFLANNISRANIAKYFGVTHRSVTVRANKIGVDYEKRPTYEQAEKIIKSLVANVGEKS